MLIVCVWWGGGSAVGIGYGVKCKTVKPLFVVVLRTPMERRHTVICTTEIWRSVDSELENASDAAA